MGIIAVHFGIDFDGNRRRQRHCRWRVLLLEHETRALATGVYSTERYCSNSMQLDEAVNIESIAARITKMVGRDEWRRVIRTCAATQLTC